MKKIILIGFTLIFNLAFCQKTQPEKMIKQFVIDLFDDEVKPENIVDNYIEIKYDDKNSLSMLERKKGVLGIINKTRNGESKELGWIVPDYEIKKIKEPKIYPLEKYENLDELGIKSYTKYKESIFVLLDPKKKKILQYFLLNKTNDKIISFSLFQKSDLAWFFGY